MFFPVREVPGSTPIQNTGFSRDVAVDVMGLEARTCSRINPISKMYVFDAACTEIPRSTNLLKSGKKAI
jgi:hypothetical protein